jgi:class 3 adenylate cyclase/HAMP domain-containing protein
MSIRAKVVTLVLPLIIAPLLLTGYISSLSARNGITSIATSFLKFKMDDIQNYGNSQWSLLVQNSMVSNQEFVDAAKTAVSSYARSLVREEAELILAIDAQGKLVFTTADVTLSAEELALLTGLRDKGTTGWTQLRLGNVDRVAQAQPFVPFNWYILVTEKRDAFYKTTSQIMWQTGIVLSVSLAVAVILLLFFSYVMTQPMRMMVGVMRHVMSTNDLSQRVQILYKDETGELGHSFNLMTETLDKAYQQIKGYALKAVIAQHKEQKIRNIFQKYVPKSVIEDFFANPESMLVGEDRVVAILFSDIRGFTTLSQGLSPNVVVESLNDYFGRMVDVIVQHQGTVDKYIGDAIMAVFGAPEKYEDKAFRSVSSALDMLDALKIFNEGQRERSLPAFKIGIGINYGLVTVGNIGSEKKMEYTVIGEMVNRASRIEGLTKVYREELIISESVAVSLKAAIPCRLIDKVVVKGEKNEMKIYIARRSLAPAEAEAWKIHEQALDMYYARDFSGASQGFLEITRRVPGDAIATRFLERCTAHLKNPPAETWTGAVVMSEK